MDIRLYNLIVTTFVSACCHGTDGEEGMGKPAFSIIEYVQNRQKTKLTKSPQLLNSIWRSSIRNRNISITMQLVTKNSNLEIECYYSSLTLHVILVNSWSTTDYNSRVSKLLHSCTT